MSARAEREAKADAALRAVLKAHHAGKPAINIASPPGAGKSGTIVHIGAQGFALRERTLILTNTHEQSLDLSRKFASTYSKVPVTFFVKGARVAETRARAGATTTVTSDKKDLARPGQLVIANVAKAHYVSDVVPFDYVVIDEAYQTTDASFHLIANLAERHIQVGDPGQILPIYRSDVSRYNHDKSGPHRPAPEALLARHGATVTRLQLPVSRRLPMDTAALIQPVLYPQLPFEGLCDGDERYILAGKNGTGWVSGLRSILANRLSLASFVLPKQDVSLVDPGIVDAIEAVLRDLVGRTLMLNGDRREITHRDIGVVVAHRQQVSVLRGRLGSDVFVETANRFQGLEKPIILAWHPGSSSDAPSDFHLDIGRLCVALSRHQVFCGVFYRDGLEERISQSEIEMPRMLNRDEDPEHAGRVANLELLRLLGERCRRVVA